MLSLNMFVQQLNETKREGKYKTYFNCFRLEGFYTIFFFF